VETRDQSVGRRSAWVMNLSAHSVECVSPADLNIWETAWCGPDAIAAIVSEGSSEDDWYRAQLARIDLKRAEVEMLYKPQAQLGSLSGSPDGRYVAVVEAVCSDRYLCAGKLLIVDSSGVGAQSIETLHVDVTFTTWRDNAHLLIAGIRHLETVVAELDLVAGGVSEQWRSEELYSQSPFYPQAVPCGPKGFAMVVHGFQQPQRVVRGEAGHVHTVVNLGHAGTDAIARQLRPVEPYRWAAPDGQEIEGWLMRGVGSKPAPLVMEVHGGPIWRWSPFFLGRSAYHFMLSELGYAFFWPNPRGSSGRGQEFARTVVGDIGGMDARDLLSGIDALVAAGIADAGRIGVMGASYGGFTTSWLITQDLRFSAAISVSPITNWVSHHLTCNIPYFDAYSLASDYSDQGGHYFTRSPITFAHRAKTPTLNICGALDRCTPSGQAREFHNALLHHGVETELVTYPTEGHGVRSFPAIIDYAARIVDWFTWHLPEAR
jgi:dipeptidyl aminopeptidase/acylaminoacyl peptidase